MNDPRRTLTATNLTVMLALLTIALAMSVAIAAGVFAVRAIGTAEGQRDAALVEVVELRKQAKCEAAVAAANDLIVLDNLEAMGGYIVAKNQELSLSVPVDQLAAAHAKIIEAREARQNQQAECTG